MLAQFELTSESTGNYADAIKAAGTVLRTFLGIDEGADYHEVAQDVLFRVVQTTTDTVYVTLTSYTTTIHGRIK